VRHRAEPDTVLATVMVPRMVGAEGTRRLFAVQKGS